MYNKLILRSTPGHYRQIALIWHLAVILVFCFSTLSYADTSSLLSTAEAKELHKQQTWIKLIHYEQVAKNSVESAIFSEEFFLSPNGRTNPKAELQATIRAFMKPGDGDDHAQCKFRARYLWLNAQLPSMAKSLPAVECPTYKQWTFDRDIESVSVVLATGYLGNPASYYGHTLLKFNRSEKTTQTNLLDSSVNYGAIIPDNENMLVYIAKGVSGGYEAGFTHIQYYHHNHKYGELELRDLWEYELNLTPEQRELIVAHTWELLGKKYTYYFFRKNCAYRMTEVLELIDGVNIIPKNRPWTVPQTIMQNLADASLGDKPLVSNIIYHPSRQSRFYDKFTQLSPVEKSLVNEAVSDIKSLEDKTFKQQADQKKKRVVETLLDYYQFYEISQTKNDRAISNDYRKVLNKRYTLSSGKADFTFTPKPDPASGRRPSRVSAAYAYNSELEQSGAILTLRPAYYDVLDSNNNHVLNSKLRMGELTLAAFGDDVYIQTLDIVSIESVNSAVSGLPGDNGQAWKLRGGFDQQRLGCDDCLVAKFEADIGKSLQVFNQQLIGGYLGGAFQNKRNDYGIGFVRASAFANLYFAEETRARIYFERRLPVEADTKAKTVVNVEARYAIEDQWDIRFQYDFNETDQFSLSVGYYW